MKSEPQTAIDEKVIESNDLEAALEDRERAKGAASEARRAYQTKDDAVKEHLEGFALADGEVARCGRFRIEKQHVPSKAVSFETEPTSRLSIGVDAEG